MFRGERLIVRHKLRDNMIKRIHAGHLGVEKSKNRARDLLFWPGQAAYVSNDTAQIQKNP